MPFNVQAYGLAFLLGTLTVASLSDLRRMAAQKDFAEVWAIFTGIFLLHDILTIRIPAVFFSKWILIVLPIITVARAKTFSLSLMDTSAICAAASLLEPVEIIEFYMLIICAKTILNPVLKKFGEGGAVPFLPVVLVSTVIMLAMVS